MTILFVFLSGLAAIFIGWALGPVTDILEKKITELPSAKKSEELNKYENKYYSTIGLEMFNDKKKSKKDTRTKMAKATCVFLFLALALIINKRAAWELSFLAILFLIWHEFIAFINPFHKEEKK